MFLAEMERMLGEEYQAFLASSRESEILSLRVNLLKGSAQKLAEQTDFLLEEVPWAKGGFYYRADARPEDIPSMKRGPTTFRRQAPWRRRRLWEPARERGYWIYALPPAGKAHSSLRT